MFTKYCSLWRSYFLLLAFLSWICYQFVIIHEHVVYALTSNPRRFAERFNVIGISRTNLHSKTLEYWLDWFNHKTIQQVGNTTFTLLHFDYHSNYDITHDAIHTCSPSQLIYYHQLVEQTFDSIDHLFGARNISNISQYIYQYGYINQIIWIYPDHWINYTQLFINGLNYHRFRNLISNMTYYLTPITNDKYEYTFSANGLTTDEIEFFQTKLSFSKIITPHSSHTSHTYDSATSIRFRIHAIPLSELQALIVNSKIFENNKVILDVDLDFFICQSPSETLKDYFNWNQNEMADLFNTYLSHHQYAPSHIHAEDLQYAMMVLLHQLSAADKPHQTAHALDESVSKHKDKMEADVPQIADAMQYATESHLSPLELRALLYHLYRFHLEIGDAEFVKPMSDYIETHQHLDSYLFSVNDNDSYVVDHHTLHNKIAETMQMNHMNDILYNVSLNEFGQINDFNHHSNYAEMAQWIENHKLISAEVEDQDLNEVDEAEFISNWLKNLRKDGSIYKLTPNLLSDIVHNLTAEQNYNLSLWTEIVRHSSSIKNISMWAPNHVQFVHSLEQQYGIDQVHDDYTTYPESLEQLKVSGDYLYFEWQHILNHHARNSNASWINRYVGGKNTTPHLEDHALDGKSTLSAHNLSNLLPWDSLDPIQKHFLRKGNHNLLEKFISSLSKHQRKFLDWLIFCHLHGDICENGHSPIDLLGESSETYSKLQNVDWEDINELPAIISSEKHNDMLQFTTVFHSFEAADNKPSQLQYVDYVPSVDEILDNIYTIQNILIDNKVSIMTIGIEMSYGHIPKNIQQWLDCQVSISLYNALQNESQFVRFQTFDKDKQILNNECFDEL